MKLLGYIPARKGSKRLKDKNFIPFYKEFSLTEIAILQARKLNGLGKIVLDTDNDDFALSMSLKYKDIFIYKREKENSTDISSIHQTLQSYYYKNKKDIEDGFSHTIILQPTSPFRDSKYLDQAIQKLKKK